MPNRILRDGILESELVNRLDVDAELFYRRLMSAVDDFGRYSADPKILRARLYPLRVDEITCEQVRAWSDMCAQAGLIDLYEVDGKKYLHFKKLGSPRAKESRYPAPPSAGRCEQLRAYEIICAQTDASVPYSYSGSGSGSGSNTGSYSSDQPAAVHHAWMASPLETVATASAARHPNRDRSAGVDRIAQALISAGAAEGEMLARWDTFHASYSSNTSKQYAAKILSLIADGAWKIAQPDATEEKPRYGVWE